MGEEAEVNHGEGRRKGKVGSTVRGLGSRWGGLGEAENNKAANVLRTCGFENQSRSRRSDFIRGYIPSDLRSF